MSFPAYPSYRHSEIDWLGEIPADWRVQKFRFTFRESGEKIESEVVGPMLSVSGYRGIEIKEYDDENQRRAEEDLIGYRIVRPGQLVVNTMWLNYAGLGVSAHEGHVSPAYRAYWLTDRNADPRFVHYLLRSSIYVQGYTQLLTGIRPNSLQMSRSDLMDFPVLLPPLSVQTAVAAFLDRETGKIDALIEEQRRLIALLKEKRQAVISHAVTKGLDPNAPMKDSGIVWLGEVPAHWNVVPLKFLATVQTGLAKGKDHGDEATVRLPYLRVANVQNGHLNLDDVAEIDVLPADVDRYRLQIGDVLMNEGGDFDKLGRGDVWQGQIPDCLHQNHVFAVRPIKVTSTWLNLVNGSGYAQTFFILRSKQTTNLASISSSNLMELPVVMPPPDEQIAIERAVSSMRSKLDELTIQADLTIALLIERRSALISAAVTGKIDVRGTAQVLPFPIDRARARGLIATEIIERSAHQATFGRVKFQKIAFLAEAHIGISELAGSYTREAAGPLDRALIEEMESVARSIAGIEHEQPGGAGTTVSYRLGGERGAHRHELAQWLGEDRTAKLDKLIGDFAALSTKEAEAVATLYGVWNDALCEGASPTDEEIISGFLNDWHPEKRAKFRASELPEWLGWMRRHGIVPTGSGPKTTTGRLFV